MNAVVPYVPADDAVRATYRVSPLRTELRRMDIAAGATIEDMVDQVVDDHFMRDLLQVAISTDGGQPDIVPRDMWSRVRPKAGVEVHMCAVPRGGNSNKIIGAVIMLAVVVAASAFLGPAGPVFGAKGLELTGLAASAASAAAIGVTPMVCGLLLSNGPLPPGPLA